MALRKKVILGTVTLLTVYFMFKLCFYDQYLSIVGFLQFFFCISTNISVINSPATKFYYESDFKYILNPENACQISSPNLLIFVKSSPENANERNTIRTTWGFNEDLNEKYKLFFVLGLPSNTGLMKMKDVNLQEEQLEFNDLIQQDYKEDFHNLTLKLVSQMQWSLKFCSGAKYWMTTDDDVYVNIKNLLPLLTTNNVQYIGNCYFGSTRNNNPQSKYFVPESVYPGAYYPPYCPGAGYVLSMSTVRQFYNSVADTPMLYIDDVYTGILAYKSNIMPITHPMFMSEHKTPTDLCSLSSFITSHKYNTSEMEEFHDVLTTFNSKNIDRAVACSLKICSSNNDIVMY